MAFLIWSLLVSATSISLWHPERVVAQSTQVTTCTPEWQWTYNSKQQSPCLVAAYLDTVCLGQPYIVPSLPPDYHYLGPTFQEANPCLCNSVFYSILSACGGCQSRTFANWTAWSQNCPEIFVSQFPRDIPPATEVPTWAYLNVTQTGNTFDPLAAKLVGGEQGPATSSRSPPAPTSQAPQTSTMSAVPSIGASTTPPVGRSSSPAGAIAGGVVGGIAFLSVLTVAVIWYRHHYKGQNDESTRQTSSMVGSWVRKQNQRRKKSNGGKIDLDAESTVPSVTPFPPSLAQKLSHPRYPTASPTSGLIRPGTVMQTVEDLRTVTSPRPAQGMSSMTSSPFGHTRDISDPLSPITSGFYTTSGHHSADTLPYAGSQVTRGPYTGAAEI